MNVFQGFFADPDFLPSLGRPGGAYDYRLACLQVI
jgi:hypothetical protein